MRLEIVTDYIDGGKYETIYTAKGAGVIQRTYIRGEFWDERKVYKVDTDKPYVRAYCKKFYLDGDHIKALRDITGAAKGGD